MSCTHVASVRPCSPHNSTCVSSVDPVTFGIAAIGLICGSLAYLMYYRLVTLAGPVKALSVTLLIPMFGMLWGGLFLAETITAGMLAGCALVLGGLALIFHTPAAK